MNLDLVQITPELCLSWILQRPELVEKSFSMDNPRFENSTSLYIAVFDYDTNTIIGTVKYERFCELGIQIHCYLDPEYWGTKLLFNCYELLEKFFKEAGEKFIMTMCPEDAVHAIKACKKVGFEEIGRLKTAVNWKGNINSLVILQKVF